MQFLNGALAYAKTESTDGECASRPLACGTTPPTKHLSTMPQPTPDDNRPKLSLSIYSPLASGRRPIIHIHRLQTELPLVRDPVLFHSLIIFQGSETLHPSPTERFCSYDYVHEASALLAGPFSHHLLLKFAAPAL